MGKEMQCQLDFQVDGNVLSGTMEVSGGKIEILDGTVDGDAFKYRSELTTPIGAIKVTIEGTVNGDDISFVLKNAFAKTEFNGHRE